MFSTYGKLHLNFSTIPMLKIMELGFCLAFPRPDPGLSLRLNNCDRTRSTEVEGIQGAGPQNPKCGVCCTYVGWGGLGSCG
jgi:hypothetical protein